MAQPWSRATRGLQREVTWASRLRPAPPAFAHLSGGELVLLPPHVLELLDDQLVAGRRDPASLAQFGVAAVALAGETSLVARAAADETEIPLIVLPETAEFGVLERATSRYISERRREILRRGQEAGRQLMELAIAGEPLCRAGPGTQRAVAARGGIRGPGRPLARLPMPAGPACTPANARAIPGRNARPGPLPGCGTVATTSSAEPPSANYATRTGWHRVVAPVSSRDGLLGSVSLFVPAGEEAVDDGVLASRGAAACAVTLTREQAAASARREIELNVLDEILDGALRSEVSLLQQIRRLGHDLDRTHCTIIARVDPAPAAPRRARAMAAGRRWRKASTGRPERATPESSGASATPAPKSSGRSTDRG